MKAGKALPPRRGSNSVKIGDYNQRVVLETLRRLGRASKAELARSANLTPQGVATIVDRLARIGLIRLAGKRNGQIGHPSTLYAPAPDGAYSIGLHIGRRAIDAVLVDFAGQTVRAETCEYDYPDPAEIARLARAYVLTLHASIPTRMRSRVVGVGVAMPYFLGGWSEELGFPPAVKQAWSGFDLAADLACDVDLPLYFENDASAAATAELVHGRGRETRDFIYLFVSTFIGGGLIVDGNVETGPHGNSAAFGPYPVGPSLLSTVPPPKGPFEVLLKRASVYVLTNHLRANGVPIQRAHQLATIGDRAEPYLTEWLDDCADALAQAVVGAIAVIDVSDVIIDSILPPAILARMVDAVNARFSVLVPEGLVIPAIRTGTIGPQAAAIGAAILPIYARFAPDSTVLVKHREASGPRLRHRASTMPPKQPSRTT